MICPQCGKSDMYPKRDDSQVNFGAMIGMLVGMVSLVVLLFAPLLGLLGIILAIIIGVALRPNRSVIVCPACKHTIPL